MENDCTKGRWGLSTWWMTDVHAGETYGLEGEQGGQSMRDNGGGVREKMGIDEGYLGR